jgi:ubiquinone/menaquinone biosynthesis C-methylase UbiE
MSISDEYYEDHYESITNCGLVGLVSKIVHLSMEKKPYAVFDQSKETLNSNILEVGAGQGQHAKYVPKLYKSYIQSDFRVGLLPKTSEVSEIHTYPKSVDAQDLPFDANTFDRLIATCLLIHLIKPEKGLSEWQRVVKPEGLITIYIPNESGALLRIAQHLTTRRKQKKLGIDANYLHYSEHRYNHPYLIAIIQKQFGNNATLRGFPFVWPSFNLNLWTVVTIRNKKEN